MLLKTLIRTRLFFGIIFAVALLSFAQNAFARSSIQGIVYDKQRNTLNDVDIELLNDYYQVINRARTDGSGRYSFGNLPDARYTLRALAFRYDLEDQEIQLEINTQGYNSSEGVGYFVQDFYLSPRKGGLAETELGVVFAQEIPPGAKKLYEKALKDFSAKKTNDAMNGMNEAVKIFPNYYAALHRIGKEFFILKKYTDAVPFLIKAVEVNPKSATSLYYLGFSLHYLGKEYNKAAITTLNNALILAPSSTQVLYVLGKVERGGGKFAEAEKHLLLAKKSSKIGIPEIHKELAQLYADDMKKYKEAADELELYIKVGKLDDSNTQQTKKVILSLREKAKSQATQN